MKWFKANPKNVDMFECINLWKVNVLVLEYWTFWIDISSNVLYSLITAEESHYKSYKIRINSIDCKLSWNTKDYIGCIFYMALCMMKKKLIFISCSKVVVKLWTRSQDPSSDVGNICSCHGKANFPTKNQHLGMYLKVEILKEIR